MRQQFLLIIGAVGLAAVAGCSDDPALYLGGPAGPPTELQLSDNRISLLVGQTAELGVQPRDAVGNAATATVQIATCDASMVTVTTLGGSDQWVERATVTALALGESCVVVSGTSLTDTVRVLMGPPSARIVGPDTILSGTTGTYGVEFFALDGSQLTAGPTYPPPFVRSQNTLRAVMTRVDPLTWDATGQQPGAVTLRIQADPEFGAVSADKIVTIVPGVFTGTLSATSGAAGLQVIASPGPGDDNFDSNSGANLAGQAAWAEVLSPTNLLVAIPATGTAGAQNLVLTEMGPNETARFVAFTANSAFDDQYGSDTDDPSTAPAYTVEVSPGNWVYFTHSGFGTGAASRGIQNGGPQPDHYFTVTAGPNGGNLSQVRLEWTNAGTGSDFDLIICTLAETDCTTGFSGETAFENVAPAGGKVLTANTTYYIAASAWTSANNIHNMRLRVVGTGIN